MHFPSRARIFKAGLDSPRIVQNLYSQMEAQNPNSFFILFVYNMMIGCSIKENAF